ncbi:hypothetical protein [Acinetobacter sp. NyZ410]|uniref:hypothetical protein n=1 Tax=Acinetobacter sp. NyZ410 TaxID=2929509 RepID=UPI001FB96852|nr:hypothetical protein [Acinetobacter sp. NyZ410]UOH17124.1 hypothetical protein MTO68_14975 [Acinetobacter sp. NyZ410]
MRVKPIFVAISLFFPTALLFAKNIEQEKILEVNTQQHPPSASYENKPSVPTTEALLQQSQMAQRINTARVNRIVKKLKNLTIIQENADVIIYLDDSGNIKDILITEQDSEAFSNAIKTAIQQTAPFEMSKQSSLNQLLKVIRIKFRVE